MTEPSPNPQNAAPSWQSKFAAFLPEIESRLRYWFRDLDAEAREEAVDDGVVYCVLSFAGLCEKGREHHATPGTLAWFAMLQIRNGRECGCRLNSKDVCSRYAQLRREISVVPLQHRDPDDDRWVTDVIDGRKTPILDQVAARLDIIAWLSSLRRRTKSIATDLAKGFSTSEVAHKHRLSASRIAQMRRELKASWQQFQGEIPCATSS
jgi:hypothetical protein